MMRKSLFKKVGVTAVCVVSIIMQAVSFASAGNTDDKSWKFDYNGDGSDGSCTARKKEDNTYTYVKCDSTNPRALEVYAGASKGIGPGDYGSPFGSDYSTPAHSIKPGTRIYFENKAKKKGYSATYLVFSDTWHTSGKYTGVWSPDNLSGFGEK